MAQNLEVISVDDEDGIILIQGAVPGPKNGWIRITDAVKRKRPDEVPYPAGLLASENSQDAAPQGDAQVATEVEAGDEG